MRHLLYACLLLACSTKAIASQVIPEIPFDEVFEPSPPNSEIILFHEPCFAALRTQVFGDYVLLEARNMTKEQEVFVSAEFAKTRNFWKTVLRREIFSKIDSAKANCVSGHGKKDDYIWLTVRNDDDEITLLDGRLLAIIIKCKFKNEKKKDLEKRVLDIIKSIFHYEYRANIAS